MDKVVHGMEAIKGMEISELPFKLKLVGTLLFAEYPTTIIYGLENERPAGLSSDTVIIKEWVDCNDNGEPPVDRHFYYKVNTGILKDYLNGDISHLELINKANSGAVIYEDYSGYADADLLCGRVDEIPSIYLPDSSVYFRKEDAVEPNAICDYFKLNFIY